MKLPFAAPFFLSLLLSAGSIFGQILTVPVNDNFANRIFLYGTTISVTGNNILATSQAGETGALFTITSKTVWYGFVAPVTGIVQIDQIGTGFDSVVNVFRGNSLFSLQPVDYDFDSYNGGDPILIAVTAGEEYAMNIYGIQDIGFVQAGVYQLNLRYTNLEPPKNDNFADRQVISGGGASITATNAGGTRELGEPSHAGQPGAESIWYTFTAKTTGRVKISSRSPTIQTILGVYVGEGYGGLYDASTPTNAGITVSTIDTFDFTTLAGETYQIAVDGLEGRVGDITLSVAQGPLLSLSGKITNGNLAFGRTRLKTTKALLLNITNTGTESLRIKRINLPTGFSAKFSGSIAPDQTRSIKVNFAPKRRGQTGGQVTIVSDSISSPNTFRVSGTGI